MPDDALDNLALTEEEMTQLKQGEPEPEPVPEPTPEPVEMPPTQKMVPLPALHQARQEIRELKERLSSIDQLKEQIMQLRAEKIAEKIPAPPSMEEDPFGALNYQIKQLEEQNRLRDQALLEAAKQAQQEQTLKSQMDQFNNAAYQQEQAFIKVQPDYNDSLNYLANIKTKEFAALGITDPAIVQTEIRKQAIQGAAQLISQGLNHAEVFYNMAKAYGYQPKALKVPITPVSDPQFETIQKGQQAQTIKAGDAGTQASLKALLDAEGEDFDRMWKEVFGKK